MANNNDKQGSSPKWIMKGNKPLCHRHSTRHEVALQKQQCNKIGEMKAPFVRIHRWSWSSTDIQALHNADNSSCRKSCAKDNVFIFVQLERFQGLLRAATFQRCVTSEKNVSRLGGFRYIRVGLWWRSVAIRHVKRLKIDDVQN